MQTMPVSLASKKSLTIIVPFFRGFDYLNNLVDSIVQQTSPCWHLVIVAEEKSKKLEDLAKRFESNSKVQFIVNEKKLGVNLNFSKCLDLVETEYFCMPGYDDLLSPSYVEKMLDASRLFPNCSIIHPEVKLIDHIGTEHSTFIDAVKKLIAKSILKDSAIPSSMILRSFSFGNWMYFPSITWKTSEVKKVGFRSNSDIALDLFLILDLLNKGICVVNKSDVVFYYRRHSRSDSMVRANAKKRLKEEFEALNYLKGILESRNYNFHAFLTRLKIYPRVIFLLSSLRSWSLTDCQVNNRTSQNG